MNRELAQEVLEYIAEHDHEPTHPDDGHGGYESWTDTAEMRAIRERAAVEVNRNDLERAAVRQAYAAQDAVDQMERETRLQRPDGELLCPDFIESEYDWDSDGPRVVDYDLTGLIKEA